MTINTNRFYLQRLERAGGRLAATLTEIDAIVRVIRTRPDWLSATTGELGFIERSLTLTLGRVKEAQDRHTERLPHVDEWRDWPQQEDGR